jgi:hypothetical protein
VTGGRPVAGDDLGSDEQGYPPIEMMSSAFSLKVLETQYWIDWRGGEDVCRSRCCEYFQRRPRPDEVSRGLNVPAGCSRNERTCSRFQAEQLIILSQEFSSVHAISLTV